MSNTVTLWELLNRQQVVIPIIQRDYAQGRNGKEYIRRTFLKEIKKHLDEENTLTLDFVYGNEEYGRFLPLDGQQRLTTLWLLHWYVAYRAGRMEDDSVKQTLKKFTYETRISSRDFCTALCENVSSLKQTEDGQTENSIVNCLKDSTWFFAEWLQDPTIYAMIQMLGGDGSFRDDCIEGVFGNETDFCSLWEKLTQKNLITFELMVIGTDKLPLSDDLYIKMNARGKKLTDFENFKADLIDWMQKEGAPGKEKNGYAAKLDNAWTDLFWESARSDLGDEFHGNIDAGYFAFINRFVFSQICLKRDESGQYFALSIFDPSRDKKGSEKEKEPIKEKKAFDRLYEIKSENGANGTSIVYEGFDIYEDYLKLPQLKDLDRVFTALTNPEIVKVIENEIKEGDEGEDDGGNIKFTFLPRYKADGGVEPITQKGRIYFHAVFKYLLSCTHFDSEQFRRWMRVVRNLTENNGRNLSDMITCLRLVNDLAEESAMEYNWDVYEALRKKKRKEEEQKDKGSTSQLYRQWQEEVEKAAKIKEDPTLEKYILKAEQFSCFHGTIRFLYHDGTGREDWSCFYKKFFSCLHFFNDKNKVPDDKNKVPYATVKAFLRLFSSFDEIAYRHLFTTLLDGDQACWKRNILCEEDYLEKVDELLTSPKGLSQENREDYLEKVDELLKEAHAPTYEKNFKNFLNSPLIEYICGKDESYRYWYLSGDECIRRKYNREACVYVGTDRVDRNTILIWLHKEGRIELKSDLIGVYLWGKEIRFQYQNKDFIWKDDNKILLDGTEQAFEWETQDKQTFEWETQDEQALKWKEQEGQALLCKLDECVKKG